MAVRFRAIVRRWREDKPGGLSVVDVPVDLVAKLGGRRQMSVMGTCNGAAFTGSTMLVAGGGFCVGVSKAALKAAGAAVGDEVSSRSSPPRRHERYETDGPSHVRRLRRPTRCSCRRFRGDGVPYSTKWRRSSPRCWLVRPSWASMAHRAKVPTIPRVSNWASRFTTQVSLSSGVTVQVLRAAVTNEGMPAAS